MESLFSSAVYANLLLTEKLPSKTPMWEASAVCVDRSYIYWTSFRNLHKRRQM